MDEFGQTVEEIEAEYPKVTDKTHVYSILKDHGYKDLLVLKSPLESVCIAT